MVESYLLIILIIFTTVSTDRLLIVYKVGISTLRSRGGGSVEFKILKIIFCPYKISVFLAQMRNSVLIEANRIPQNGASVSQRILHESC